MNRQLALLICIVFIIFLYIRDGKLRPMTSWGLWISLIWIVLIGTRHVSAWLSMGIQIEATGDQFEGSPIDRMVLLILEIAGLLVLLHRRINWIKIFQSNPWLFVFFLYWGMSIFWSDYSFVSFKRWIKDIGNIIMVLIILTEDNPSAAFKAVFARFTYFAIPLSVIFIKYFPDLGRYYTINWTLLYGGVTLNKNSLGILAALTAMFLIWELYEIPNNDVKQERRLDLLARILLFLMAFWLLFTKAHSATSIVCFVIGASIIIYLNLPIAKTRDWYFGTYGILTIILILFIFIIPYAYGSIADLLGRDRTFTGRTDIWSQALIVPINPLIGTGYESFWLTPLAEYLDVWCFRANQVHNGYLETYLNGGLIGMALLLAMIISTGRNLKEEILCGNSFSTLLFAFFMTSIFYNWTEAAFNKMALIWLVFLISALNRPWKYNIQN